VASFVGAMNFYAGSLHGDTFELAGGARVPVDSLDAHGRGAYEIGVRPEDVSVSTNGGGGAEAVVVREIQRGHYKELVLKVGEDEMRAFVAPELAADGGLRVRFTRAVLYRDGLLQQSEQPVAVS
jgi:ABC-type Fe3+/spermidine/putrescine transport system ATPase subunit